MAASKQSVFVDNFVKMKADVKSIVWNFFRTSSLYHPLINLKISTECRPTVITVTAYKIAK